MQGLAKLSVMRPVFATVLILALVVVGAFSIPRLGMDRFPNVDMPFVTVVTTLPGATPEEMETEVTEEIEKQVNTVSGIDTLTSTSSEGVSVVMIQFVLEKNADVAAQEVRAKVDLALPNLPKEADKPTVQKFDTTGGAVVQFTLSSRDGDIRALTEYADKKVRPQIESLSGVGQVQIVGGVSRQINVMLDPYRLRAYGLTAVDVRRALQTQNLQVPGGALDEGSRRLAVRTQGRVESRAALEGIVVKLGQGQPVRVRDVAVVEDSEAEATSLATVDGQRAVLLQIRKQSGANSVAVADAVKQKLAEIAPALPAGCTTKLVSDQSTFIKAALDAVREHLILGAILASVVVLAFLWNWRSTLISALAIPTSIISTFALVYAMGFTLNIVTLLALTLAVGIVIDDAIIVLENIYRFIEEKQMSPREAAIEATKEIGLAVLATTLSLVAVFLPVAFMTGIVGRFLNSFGLTMAFAILVSLLVAFTLTPMLSARWLRRVIGGEKGPEPGSERQKQAGGPFARLEAGYVALLRWSLGHRWAVVAASVAALVATVPLGAIARKNFLPQDDQSQFVVTVRAPEGRSLAATGALLDAMAADIRKLPEVQYTVVTAGDDPQKTQNLGTILVQMNPVEERKQRVDQFALMDRTRNEILSQYPRELRTIVSPPNEFGGSAQAEIQYVITGPDPAVLTRAADRVAAGLKRVPGATDVDTSTIVGKPELGVSVDRERAGDLGVSVMDIASTIRVAVAGEKVSDYNEDGQQYDVNLRALPEYRNGQDNLSLFSVPSMKEGVGAVPVDQVVGFREGAGPSVVQRYARTRQVTVAANLLPGASQQTVQDQMVALLKAENLGPQYRGEFAGAAREMGRTFASFGIAFLLSIIFMYLILAAQFESWLHPITILTSLPLTVPFALLSIVLLGGSLNILSMLGILVLFGVVKKNAILQVDHTNQLRSRGMQREEAIIEASRDRLRPILMTTIAFVAGMVPLVLSRGTGAATNQATGGVIMGGQTLSLMLTLVATPVFYSLMDDLSQAIARVRVRLPRRAESPAAMPEPVD